MKIIIIGNSGSGKSTFAASLAVSYLVPVLDLDSVAWEPEKVAVARSTTDAQTDVRRFCATHDDWVVEGCYAELAAATLEYSPLVVFLDPGVEACLVNCRRRPWEPHKYRSRLEQDERLSSLLAWVEGYDSRDDPQSRPAHERLFTGVVGSKLRIVGPVDEGYSALSAYLPMAPTGFPAAPDDLSFDLVSLRYVRVVAGEPFLGIVPSYYFRIVADGVDVGHINFRVGDTEHVRVRAGHVGFEVSAPHRGRGFAGKACRALAPFIRTFYEVVTIICDPDNFAFRRTIAGIGADFIDEVPVPAGDPHYERGSRSKRRYSWRV